MMMNSPCRISDWGPINPDWIAANLAAIKETLGYP